MPLNLRQEAHSASVYLTLQPKVTFWPLEQHGLCSLGAPSHRRITAAVERLCNLKAYLWSLMSPKTSLIQIFQPQFLFLFYFLSLCWVNQNYVISLLCQRWYWERPVWKCWLGFKLTDRSTNSDFWFYKWKTALTLLLSVVTRSVIIFSLWLSLFWLLLSRRWRGQRGTGRVFLWVHNVIMSGLFLSRSLEQLKPCHQLSACPPNCLAVSP